MIRVGLVSHSPHLWGAERSMISLAKLFNQKRLFQYRSNQIYPLLLIPVPKKNDMAVVAEESDIKIAYTPSNPWYIYQSPSNAYNFNVFCKKIKEDIHEYISIYSKFKMDIVIINTLTNFIPHIAAYKLKIPIITWIHGILDPFTIPGIDASYQSFIDKSIISLSNKVIFNSEWTQQQFKNIVDIKKGVVIPNWSIEPEYQSCNNKTVNDLICLNSMEPKKGIKVLVDAARILKNAKYTFHISLYGSGCELQNIMNHINTLDLNDYISVLSPVMDVSKIYSECTALIQPSYYESFGRTIIEAMSHKKPVIAATTADPMNIIIDQKSGFHIEPGDSSELAEKIMYLLNNPQKAEKMGNRGYGIYQQRFNGDLARKKMTKLICQLYNSSTDITLLQKYAFHTLNQVHKESFD